MTAYSRSKEGIGRYCAEGRRQSMPSQAAACHLSVESSLPDNLILIWIELWKKK